MKKAKRRLFKLKIPRLKLFNGKKSKDAAAQSAATDNPGTYTPYTPYQPSPTDGGITSAGDSIGKTNTGKTGDTSAKKSPVRFKIHKPSLHLPRLSKKTCIILAVNIALLAGMAVCILLMNSTVKQLPAQNTAERWAGESQVRYAQVSCFLSTSDGLTEEALDSFGDTVNKKLQEASLEATENGNLWTCAYSAKSKLTVQGDYGSAEGTAYGIGGNYFLFHPLQLRNGSYITPTDIMDDRVVLDEEMAWKLFGSVNLEGMKVTINNQPFLVAGVIRQESDKYDTQAGSGGPRFYLSYSRLNDIQETAITCYEIVLPDPISQFAYNIVAENFPLGSNGEVIENSQRFRASAIHKVAANFAQRTIVSKELAYPYWENAARLAENRLAHLQTATILLSIIPVICLIWLIIKEFIYVKHKFKKPHKNL